MPVELWGEHLFHDLFGAVEVYTVHEDEFFWATAIEKTSAFLDPKSCQQMIVGTLMNN